MGSYQWLCHWRKCLPPLGNHYYLQIFREGWGLVSSSLFSARMLANPILWRRSTDNHSFWVVQRVQRPCHAWRLFNILPHPWAFTFFLPLPPCFLNLKGAIQVPYSGLSIQQSFIPSTLNSHGLYSYLCVLLKEAPLRTACQQH